MFGHRKSVFDVFSAKLSEGINVVLGQVVAVGALFDEEGYLDPFHKSILAKFLKPFLGPLAGGPWEKPSVDVLEPQETD